MASPRPMPSAAAGMMQQRLRSRWGARLGQAVPELLAGWCAELAPQGAEPNQKPPASAAAPSSWTAESSEQPQRRHRWPTEPHNSRRSWPQTPGAAHGPAPGERLALGVCNQGWGVAGVRGQLAGWLGVPRASSSRGSSPIHKSRPCCPSSWHTRFSTITPTLAGRRHSRDCAGQGCLPAILGALRTTRTACLLACVGAYE